MSKFADFMKLRMLPECKLLLLVFIHGKFQRASILELCEITGCNIGEISMLGDRLRTLHINVSKDKDHIELTPEFGFLDILDHVETTERKPGRPKKNVTGDVA